MVKEEWETMHPMLEKRIYHSCFSVQNEIIAIGGLHSKSTEIYNAGNDSWRSGPDLPIEIGFSQVVMAQRTSKYAAFLIGGSYGGEWTYDKEPLKSIYGMRKDLKKFDKIGDLNIPRMFHTAAVLSEEIMKKC